MVRRSGLLALFVRIGRTPPIKCYYMERSDRSPLRFSICPIRHSLYYSVSIGIISSCFFLGVVQLFNSLRRGGVRRRPRR